MCACVCVCASVMEKHGRDEASGVGQQPPERWEVDGWMGPWRDLSGQRWRDVQGLLWTEREETKEPRNENLYLLELWPDTEMNG